MSNSANDANRFAALHALMKRLLIDLFVVGVGDGPEVLVYVIGRFRDRRWVGVQTVSVETGGRRVIIRTGRLHSDLSRSENACRFE